MNSLIRLLSSLLVLALIPFLTSAYAGGWGFGKGDTAVPVSGNTVGEVQFVFYDPAITNDPCPDSPPVTVIPGDPPQLIKAQTTTQTVGWLERVGWVGLDSSHCFNVNPDIPAFVAENGFVEIFDRRGGVLSGTYESVQLSPPFAFPPPDPVQDDIIVEEGVIQIEEGTGRFEGVSGKLVFRVYVRVNLEGNYGIRWVISGLMDLPE